MKKIEKNKKPATKKPAKQPKPISLKESADKSMLAKAVGGGLNVVNHNEIFIVL